MFGGGSDIRISDKCNENNDSYAYFPHSYNANNTIRNQNSFALFSGATNGHRFKITEY